MKSTAMRKPHLFSVVLSLFLLIYASITRAQTISITGVVYEKNAAKIPFTVPQGKITVYLPDDMAAGDVVSGTVSIVPVGKNEKAKKANLSELLKYTMFWPDGTPLRGTTSEIGNPLEPIFNYTFSGKIPDTKKSSATFQLKDAKGNDVSKAEMPLLLSSQTISGQGSGDPIPTESISFNYEKIKIEYKVQKKVITREENLVLQNFGRRNQDLIDDFRYQWNINNREVALVCNSPGQTIIAVPQGTIGKTSITAKDKNGKTIFSDEVYIVDIKANIDKTNLLKGDRTSLHVNLNGLKDCPYPLSMTIVNKTSQTVLLDRGIHQTYSYRPVTGANDQFGDPDQDGMNMMKISQGVTGVTPGTYDITANLILPTTAFGDVFHQQKSALKTAEDYNAWVDALKKDLKAYADKQGNDEVGKAAKANAQRAIDNISKCYDKNKLDELKAFADAYLRPVNIPKGAATMWVCGFEAYKAAIKAITGTLGGKPELIDWEVIKNGLEFIRNMGEQLNDEGLQKGANDAKKLVESIQKSGETKEKLQELKDKLDELDPALEGKISNNGEQIYNYKINDLQVSGFVHDFQPSINYTGVGNRTILNMDGMAPGNILSLEQISAREFKIEMQGPCCLEWMNYILGGQPLPNNGSISHVKTGDQPGSTLNFKNAIITEVSFPEMDAAEKNNTMIGFTFKPEDIKFSTGSEKVKPAEPKQGKQWAPSNFSFSMGDLPCKKITKMESFKITQKITADMTGDLRKQLKVPGRLEYPNITFHIPAYDIQPWYDWYNSFNKNNDTKNGVINYMNERGESLFSIPLNNVKPVQINPAGNDVYKVVIASLPVQHPAEETIEERVSKNDMIAFFSPPSKTLFYLPEYKTQIFDRFKPHLRADGKYDISLASVNRKSIRAIIDIVPANFMDLLDQEKKDSVKYDENGFESTGELIMEKWDSTSATWYRFYKNAKCKQWKEPNEGTCTPSYVKDSNGKYVESGKSERVATTGESHCYKGTDFCTEMYIVAVIHYIYDDANCKRLVKVKTYGGWSCE